MARPDDDDDFYDQVESMADRLQLKGRDRAKYIDDHMTGGGYRRVQNRESYERLKDDDDEDNGDSSWIPRNRRSGRSRSNQRSRRRDDDDDTF